MTEHEIATELMTWVKYHMRKYPFLSLFHHVANEGKRSRRKTAKEGLLAGLPDYHLPVATRAKMYCGLWLELKATGKSPTAKQFKVMDDLESWGNYVCWTDDLSEAIRVTDRYCQMVYYGKE
jgi:hypothetical protein